MSSTSYSNYLLSSEFSESSSVDTASNRKSSELSGDFGDGLCGEALFTQHLLIDFTPNTDIDNDIVQKKVCEFWECIKNAPHIHHLMVKPEKKSTLCPKDCIELLKAAQGKTDVEKTAIAMLELVKEEGLIERAFEANLPPAVCTVDTGEYKENVLEIMQNDKKRRLSTTSLCSSTDICRPGSAGEPHETLTPAKRLCKKLEEWDSKHPKSMEPPGHPPSLQQCILQRHVFHKDQTSV